MMYRLFFQGASASFLKALVDDRPRCVVILRNLDSTPVHVVFGELQAQLEPVARYFRPCMQIGPVTGAQRHGWDIVDYEEYRRLHPHRPRVGVLELLAMHGSVASVLDCPAGQVAPLNGQRFFLPLCVY